MIVPEILRPTFDRTSWEELQQGAGHDGQLTMSYLEVQFISG
jgi:hypothetical protein